MRGRKPKQGADPKVSHRKPKPAAPVLRAGPAECPPAFDEHERACWGWLQTELSGQGRAGSANMAAMVGCCLAAGLAWRARAECDAVTYGANDLKKKNPATTLMLEALSTMRQYLGELGLTPATYGKCNGHSEKPADPFEDFLRGGNSHN